MRNIHLSVGALERSSAQSAHCLMVLINGLASSGAFAHYCVLFMLSWVMMPTQQLLPQPFRWYKRGLIIIKRWRRNRRNKELLVIIQKGKKDQLIERKCQNFKCTDFTKISVTFHRPPGVEFNLGSSVSHNWISTSNHSSKPITVYKGVQALNH